MTHSGHSTLLRSHSRIGTLWNIPYGSCAHSTLMFANLTTLPHFSVSFATIFLKSAGEPAVTVTPNSASRAFTLGSARAAFISLLSLSTTSTDVPFGAAKPNHALDS